MPYNSGAQAIVDLLADRLDAMFLVIPPIKQHVEAASSLALATLNAKRVQALPNVPTMAELGRPEMTSAIWFGYLAPAKTPDAMHRQAGTGVPGAEIRPGARQARRPRWARSSASPAPPNSAKSSTSDRPRYGKIVAEGNLATQN